MTKLYQNQKPSNLLKSVMLQLLGQAVSAHVLYIG